MTQGPTLPISEEIHAMKYRGMGETFKESCVRQAHALKDSEDHYYAYKDILLNMRFLPAGRVQAAVGSLRSVTPYNCFVSGTITDSMVGIMDRAKEAAETMRLGGGIGYDFSTLRPRGAPIGSSGASSSGPISFMDIFNAVCGTIAAAGNRRGAQMGCLRVDHPDIEEFIHAKRNTDKLTNFNISVLITDQFMECLKEDREFPLVYEGRTYKTVSAKNLWDTIMRSTWDWAEPGVLFIDTINGKNNLWYTEEIAATNPCGEQPLPPYGACLLGSINLTKYLFTENLDGSDEDAICLDLGLMKKDIPWIIRSMDNVIDVARYPLPAQEKEAKDKRRMGIGITGLANTLETMGMPYGSEAFKKETSKILRIVRDESYKASTSLAKEKGAFPLYHKRNYCSGSFIGTLPKPIREGIEAHGIRNSHLLSIAPTGTISLAANNISSGVEPVFSHSYSRTILKPDGAVVESITDWAYREYGVKGVKATAVSVQDHVSVLIIASAFVDSAVSKTCNVGPEVGFDEFANVYLQAYYGGASGCTTFRTNGKRKGILVEDEDGATAGEVNPEGAACVIDPTNGIRSCE